MRHELTHLKRRDLWYKLLLVLVRCVHWYNPLVHLLGAAAERDLERSCDAAVVTGRDTAFRAAYGHAVLDAAEAGLGGPLTTAFRDGKGALRERLAAILDTEGKRRGVAVLGLVLAATVGFAACVSVTEQPTYTVGPCVFSVPRGWQAEAYGAGWRFFRDGAPLCTVRPADMGPEFQYRDAVTTSRNITLSPSEDYGEQAYLTVRGGEGATFPFARTAAVGMPPRFFQEGDAQGPQSLFLYSGYWYFGSPPPGTTCCADGVLAITPSPSASSRWSASASFWSGAGGKPSCSPWSTT